MSRRIFLMAGSLLTTLSTLSCLSGCGGSASAAPKLERTAVYGLVTFDGKPLLAGHGVIFMEPVKGFLAYGETDSEGRYEVNSWNNGDMPVGTYKVRVGGPPAPPPATGLTAEEAFDHPELVDPPAPPIIFPRKYLDENTSDLTFEVKAGPNTCDIDLKPE